MTVKADSKGRLTGAQPETRYLKRIDPDGTITYVPEVPNEFDEIRDVTAKQFEEFFGVNPNYTVAEDIQVFEKVTEKGFNPSGLVFQRFAINEEGERVYTEDGHNAKRLRTLIRIRKEDS